MKMKLITVMTIAMLASFAQAQNLSSDIDDSQSYGKVPDQNQSYIDDELYGAEQDEVFVEPMAPPEARRFMCVVRNGRGQNFYATGHNLYVVRQRAIDACRRVSVNCYVQGCRSY